MIAENVRSLDAFLHSELAAEMYVDEVLDGSGNLLYVDRVGSVSALSRAEQPLRHISEYIPKGFPHAS